MTDSVAKVRRALERVIVPMSLSRHSAVDAKKVSVYDYQDGSMAILLGDGTILFFRHHEPTDVRGVVEGYNVSAPVAAYHLYLLGLVSRHDWEEFTEWFWEADKKMMAEAEIARLHEKAKSLGYDLVKSSETKHG